MGGYYGHGSGNFWKLLETERVGRDRWIMDIYVGKNVQIIYITSNIFPIYTKF